MAASVVLGKGPACTLETLQSRVLAGRHDYLTASGEKPATSRTEYAAPPAQDQKGIPAQIAELADLRDKGILTAGEFQDQKAKLLARL
jgi:hypothetical protein